MVWDNGDELVVMKGGFWCVEKVEAMSRVISDEHWPWLDRSVASKSLLKSFQPIHLSMWYYIRSETMNETSCCMFM